MDFTATCKNGNTQLAQRMTITAITTKSLMRNLLTACAPPAEVDSSLILTSFFFISLTSWKNYDLSTDGFPAFRYIFSKEAFPHINYLVSHIIHELEEQNPCYQISARSLLCSLYIELYRIESLGGVNPNTAKPDSLEILALQERKKEGEIAENSLVISPALEYIEKNYMQQFSIEYLADLCHWSPTHFRRVFHDIMGTSPLDYVNNTRILKSCILLRSTEHSILDISEMVGFHSVSSFNRYFIKLMQMSPREYRKQMQQSEKKAENQSILEFAGWMRPE